ncbi:hypothetical protein GOBAR_DD18807 [Gossypium barbadense]|nr:hypothetical protein GOBAR_DD18807 [Gossypium barbadense]
MKISRRHRYGCIPEAVHYPARRYHEAFVEEWPRSVRQLDACWRRWGRHAARSPGNRIVECLETIDKEVTDEMNKVLPNDVLLDEIQEAIFHLGPYKVLGLDRFMGMFYHKYRDTIKDDVIALVKNFFAEGILPSKLNITNLLLMPNTINLEWMVEFKPKGC